MCYSLFISNLYHSAFPLSILFIFYTECPDGLRCSSTNPSHYKRFNHSLLAHSRANSSLSLSEEGNAPGLSIREVKGFTLDTSQEGVSAVSSSSTSSSPRCSQTGIPSKMTSGLQLLRSPCPEDFKKKKGWSPSAKSQRSVSSSQESKTQLSSTPLKAESEARIQYLPRCETSLNTEDSISYSPLSELPAEDEVPNRETRRLLFNKDASEPEGSVEMFTDSFSSEDELLVEFIEKMEPTHVQVQNRVPSNTQLQSVTSAPPTNHPIQQAAPAFDQRAGLMVEKETPHSSTGLSKGSLQSPQSIVLEQLRETIQGSVGSKPDLESEEPHASSPQVSSSERSQTMPPQKGHAKPGQASCLKQTDIGVFFGLKPLKESEKKMKSGPNELDGSSASAAGETSRRRGQPRGEGQRRRRADAPAGTSAGSAENGIGDAQGETKNHRRRRWRSANAHGGAELPRCPFYKKIPGA